MNARGLGWHLVVMKRILENLLRQIFGEIFRERVEEMAWEDEVKRTILALSRIPSDMINTASMNADLLSRHYEAFDYHFGEALDYHYYDQYGMPVLREGKRSRDPLANANTANQGQGLSSGIFGSGLNHWLG